MNKLTLAVLVVLIAGAYFVGYVYPRQAQLAGSPVGTTFNTAKIAMINSTPSSSSATSTSELNSDASARYIKNAEIGCSGLAAAGTSVATLTLTAATTSTNAPANIGNTNSAFVATVATSSTSFVMSSTTTQLSGNFLNDVWPAGSYLTFVWNSTNAAACTIGVSYLGS